MEPIRERIEEFLQRYWHEQNRVVRVLGVAVAILLALLLALRWLRVLAVPVLVGGDPGGGVSPLRAAADYPSLYDRGPVVRNGVAVIVACGKKSGFERMGAAMKYAPSLGRAREGTSEGATAQCGITTPRMPPSARRATSVRSNLRQAVIGTNSCGHAGVRY